MTVLGLFIIGTKTATVLIVSDSGSFSRFNQFSDLHHGNHLHRVFSTWLQLQYSRGREALLPQHGGPTQGAPLKMVLFLVLLTTSWTSHQSRFPAPSVELPQRRQHGKDHLEQACRGLFFPGAQHQHAGQETCGQLSVSGTGKHVLVVRGVAAFSRIKTPSEDCLSFQNNHHWPCLGNLDSNTVCVIGCKWVNDDEDGLSLSYLRSASPNPRQLLVYVPHFIVVCKALMAPTF